MQDLEKKQVAFISQSERLFRLNKFLGMNKRDESTKIRVSIIIPTLNEAQNVAKLIKHLLKYQDNSLTEIIVVDGGSTDNTPEIAQKAGAKVIICTQCGRAHQMNKGSQAATGDLLYFIHCDTLPPSSYLADIKKAVANNYAIGCFQAKFDTNRLLVKTNGFWSRLDFLFCRGGDQTLFVTKKLFNELNGYKEELLIMEEYDFLIRARKKYPFKIIPTKVLVSARKYHNRSYFKVQFANVVVFNMFRFGASQKKLVRTYKKLLG